MSIIPSGRLFTHEQDSTCVHCHKKIFRNRYLDDNTLSPWMHVGGTIWCEKLTAEPIRDTNGDTARWEGEGGQ